MDIAVMDCRKYGKQRRYYVLRQDAVNDSFLPEPSPVNWREVTKENFTAESILVFSERSKTWKEQKMT